LPKKRENHKDKKRLEELQGMLMQERSTLLRKSNHDISSDAADVHGDMADLTAEISQREQLLWLAEHERERLRQIEDALEMVAEGKYGVCAECGDQIPDPRLKAIPTANHCIKCQSMVERRV